MTTEEIQHIRNQFPILNQEINNQPLVYFDNGATTQKPQVVIDAIIDYYSQYNANVHRGIHTLSQRATDKMEAARKKTQQFIHAEKEEEIIFCSGTTAAINIVAYGLTDTINQGDEIIISGLEHHANIVPWQMLCERTGAILKIIPVLDSGMLDIETFKNICNEKTKIVCCNYVSNALGIINPIDEILSIAKQNNALTLIDGAQAIAHFPIDVQKMNVDFFVFSGHKIYGPTGIGILYGKYEILNQLKPTQGGGEMIDQVTFEKTTYAQLPFRLEAGTPHIEGIIALATALDWVSSIGYEKIQTYEKQLLAYATEKLANLSFLTLYGQHVPKAGVISFSMNVPHVHPSDVGAILDKMGIAVRTGHHCAQPIMQRFNIPGTIRASFAIYNTLEEIDKLILGLEKAHKMLA